MPRTLQDLARQAGVSVATASKALSATSGRYRVAEATRERVRQAARELGISPRQARPRQGRIALLFGGESPNLQGSNTLLHLALVSALVERQVEVLWRSMDRGCAETRRRVLARVDGCLLLDRVPATEAGWSRWLSEIARFPPAVAINPGRSLPIPAVSPDDAGGCRLLLEALARRGHRQLALIGHLRHSAQHGSQFRRHAALLEQAQRLRLRLEDWSDQEDTVVAQRLVQAGARGPTGLVGLSGFTMPATWSVLVAAGLAVPQRLALITCDDPPLNQELRPPISGLGCAPALLVRSALQVLDRTIDGAPCAGEILVPVQVQERDSTLGWQGKGGEKGTSSGARP